jgi:dienelactone hydrolase
VTVARLLNATRGWNAGSGEPAPVRDAEWALRQLNERFGELPIGLVGHSMGGRTALRVAGHPLVRAVVGLAPWLPPGEPIAQLSDRRVLLMHGTSDRTTDPAGTAAFAARLEVAGVPVSLVRVNADGHPMLRRRKLWHDLSSQFVLSTVLPDYQPSDSFGAPNLLRQVIDGQARITY